MYRLILVSSSPNRKAVLEGFGVPFEVEYPTNDESLITHSSPVILSQKRARTKVDSVKKKYDGEKAILLGCDTLIEAGSTIFGKPKNKMEAVSMLRSFSSTHHRVISSIFCLNTYTKKTKKATSISKVWFKDLEEKEIDYYIRSGEWQGVAGSYRIQGQASYFIRKIQGSYWGIIGLPIHELYKILTLLSVEKEEPNILLNTSNI